MANLNYVGSVAERFMKYAGGYQPEQIEWLLQHRPELFVDAQMRVKASKLLDIKKRIFNLEPREGTFFIQDFNRSLQIIRRSFELKLRCTNGQSGE